MLGLRTERRWRVWVLPTGVALVSALAACGGGHDPGDTATQPPAKQPHYVSFAQGDPGLPGDGITVSFGIAPNFELSIPIRLGAAPAGYTISTFVPRGSPAPDDITIYISNGRAEGDPCRDRTVDTPASTSEVPAPKRKVEVNGAAGLVSLYTAARTA